jgi:hypothetical protein
MSGTPEREEHGIPERIREVMVQFDVDEEKARLLLGCGAVLASKLFAKWKSNLRRIQTRKARTILQLIEKAEKGDIQALQQAKAQLEEICRVENWEK